MIVEPSQLGETRSTDADVCIIGGGAAGLSLAAEFLGTRWRVVVLESGSHHPDAFGEALNDLDCLGLPHDGARLGRRRGLGGTTRAWGGQLLPLRSSEVEPRAWVPHSGWPLTLDELQPFYRRVEAMLGVEGPPYDAQTWKTIGIAPPAFDARRFCVRFSQWAPLTRRNFAVLMRRAISSSRNVTVFLDSTVTSLDCTVGGENIRSVRARSREGRTIEVRARVVVLACGAIETPRLLLAHGLANRSGLVGRFFQDHISYVAGVVQPRSRAELQRLFDPRYLGRTMLTAKIEPTDTQQRDQGMLNAMGHIAFEIPEALGLLEIRRLLRAVQSGELRMPRLEEVCALVRGGGELTRLVFSRLVQRRRRSPSYGGVRLLVDVEQAPNPESRITLSQKKDALGVPLPALDWRLSGQEQATLSAYSRALAAEFDARGLGSVTLAETPEARDIFHHMGTTRMSGSAKEGVTNTDLRCHDVDNLFVASAAVFPTGGIANPTMTILALSLRLADHLKGTLGRQV